LRDLRRIEQQSNIFGQEPKPYEPNLIEIDPHAGGNAGRIDWMHNQELRASANHAADQQDE
jgi:hypothetical protein